MRLLALAFCLISSTAHALCGGASFMDRLTTEERQQIAHAVSQTPYGQGLVWQATKDDKVINLIGTMHIADPRLGAVFDEVVGRVFETDLLLVEATAKEEAEIQALFAANPEIIFITEGPTLPEQFDEAAWNAISAATRARSIPPFLAAKMQPWYLTLTLAIPPCAIPNLAAGARGLDHMLMRSAEQAQIEIQALEPSNTLIDVMRRGTAEEQREALRLSLLGPELQSEMFVAMLDAYFSEDVAKIWEASRISANYIPEMDPETAAAVFAETEEYLLVRRNQAWIPVIMNALESRVAVTVAVGAAHLPGEQGLLNLLNNQGWTIQRMRF